MSEHLTDLELELARTAEAGEAASRHLATCSECRRRLALLERLAGDLAVEPQPIEVPEEIDRMMLAMVRQRAAEVRDRNTRTSWWPARQVHGKGLRRLASLAAAAALVLAVLLVSPQLVHEPPSEPGRLIADINADGAVDILDALVMATAMEQGRADGSWDQNGDGIVDRRDMDRIARAAVAIGGRR